VPVIEEVTLKIACPAGAPKRVLERYGKPWAATHHARLEFVDPDRDADVRIIPPVSLPRLAEAGQLTPVPDTFRSPENGFGWMNLLPLYRNKLLTWNDTAYALPVLGDASVCFYRADLLRDAGHQTAFRDKFGRPLEPPTTWEEYADIAEFFRGKVGEASLPPLPEKAEDLDRLFFSIAAPYLRRAAQEDAARKNDVELFSCHYDIETLKPRIDTPGFVHALKLLKRLQVCRPKGTSVHSADTFRQGKAVLCVAPSEWAGKFAETDSPVREKFAIGRVPGSAFCFDFETGKQVAAHRNFIPYVGVGGWLGVVPKNSAHAAEAFDLLATIGSAASSTEVVLDAAWAGQVYRREHLDSRTPWTVLGLGSERTRQFTDALRAEAAPEIINPVVRLRTPDEEAHQKALVEELRKALTEQTDAAAALQNVAKRWEQLDAGKDVEARRRAYRLSLGLSAKRR
jgi:multiple sugar transport system substrate-binding protein